MWEASMLAMTSGTPWWATNRDRLFMVIVVVLLASVLGLIPSAMTQGIDRLLQQHSEVTNILKVMCVHDAQTEQRRAECVIGALEGP